VEYKCERCKAETRKTKAMQLYTPPATLVLHLKRFSSRGGGGGGGGGGVLVALGAFGRAPSFARMRKNTAAVDVPARLNIAPHCNAEGLATAHASGLYELIAVSEHSGSMGGGHYTATGCAVSDGQWYEFNDSRMRRVSCPEGPSSSAYVLFYRMVPS
jgi:ubiquitin carboxyl-terminal hydrolase 4/11